MKDNKNKKTIGNWFCLECHAENESYYSRCTFCKRGEKNDNCVIQSPKKMTSIKEKNRAELMSSGNLQRKPSSGVLQKSTSGALSRSSSSLQSAAKEYQTVSVVDPFGNIIEVEIISHVCKWNWVYCSGFCEGSNTLESSLYDSKVDLFFDLVEEEVIVARDTVIVSNIVYNDEWLNSVNIGLSLMGLLSESLKRDDENNGPISKSGKREKKKEQSATKIEALKQRMTSNSEIMQNLQSLTPSKKKTNSKAQKVKISIYGGTYNDDEYDEEDEYDSEEYEDEEDYEDQSRKSHEWVRMVETYDEVTEISKILEEEIEQKKPIQTQTQPAQSLPAQNEIKKEATPMTFAQLQQQQMKSKSSQPKPQQQQPSLSKMTFAQLQQQQSKQQPKQQPKKQQQQSLSKMTFAQLQQEQSKQQPKQQSQPTPSKQAQEPVSKQPKQPQQQKQPKYNNYDDYDDFDYDY